MIALTKGLIKPHYHIRLNNGFRKDLGMRKQSTDNWNGTYMFINKTWEDSHTLAFYTDASDTEGFRGIYGKDTIFSMADTHLPSGEVSKT